MKPPRHFKYRPSRRRRHRANRPPDHSAPPLSPGSSKHGRPHDGPVPAPSPGPAAQLPETIPSHFPPLPPPEMLRPDSRQIDAILHAWRDCEAAWDRAFHQLLEQVQLLSTQTAQLTARLNHLRNP